MELARGSIIKAPQPGGALVNLAARAALKFGNLLEFQKMTNFKAALAAELTDAPRLVLSASWE